MEAVRSGFGLISLICTYSVLKIFRVRGSFQYYVILEEITPATCYKLHNTPLFLTRSAQLPHPGRVSCSDLFPVNKCYKMWREGAESAGGTSYQRNLRHRVHILLTFEWICCMCSSCWCCWCCCCLSCCVGARASKSSTRSFVSSVPFLDPTAQISLVWLARIRHTTRPLPPEGSATRSRMNSPAEPKCNVNTDNVQ